MSDERFRTLRHIETVRNVLNVCIRELLLRSEQHDQSKLQEPERAAFDEFTPKLRGSTYGSKEYYGFLEQLKDPLRHHYEHNRHHPEHFTNGIRGMNLIDVLEMFCDWKASGMRHADGSIYTSIRHNQKRFELSDDLTQILLNTADWLETQQLFHHAEES